MTTPNVIPTPVTGKHALVPALLLLVAVLLTACGTEEKIADGPTVRTVQAKEVRPVSQVNARSFSGTLRAPLETNLSFRVPGQVTDVRVDVGTSVSESDVIAQLDAEDYRLEVDAARASYQQAKAAADNARSELQRIKSLYANDNASLSAYDRARTQYETTKNQAEAAKRQLDLARKRLGYTRLTAPASGSIASKMVQEGENVRVGQPVARLTAGERLEVQVHVPEDLISNVEVGRSATVTSTASADGPLPATVTEVASAPSGSRPTYPVVVTLDDAAPSLRSGMSARVGFRFGDQTGMVVPTGAVGRDANGPFVYVVAPAADTLDRDLSTAPDGRVERRSVSPGEMTPGGLVVTGSLSDGERVVTAGIGKVREGDLVRISRLFTTK